MVLRLKRSADSSSSSSLQQWLTIANYADFDNLGLLLTEIAANRQLQLLQFAFGTSFWVTSIASLNELPSPNQENWICASVCISHTAVNWTVGGVGQPSSFVTESTAYPNIDAKWNAFVLGQKSNAYGSSLTGVVQSLSIVSSCLSEQQVVLLC